jgi:cytochrome c5
MPSIRNGARFLGLGLACLLTAIIACNDDGDADHDHGEHDHDAMVGPDTGAVCPDDSTLTYDNFGADFMTKYCNSCHAESVKGAARMEAPADHNFDTRAEIELLAKHIDEYAGSGPDNTNTHMPPAGSPAPSKDDRAKLSEWIACGVP